MIANKINNILKIKQKPSLEKEIINPASEGDINLAIFESKELNPNTFIILFFATISDIKTCLIVKSKDVKIPVIIAAMYKCQICNKS